MADKKDLEIKPGDSGLPEPIDLKTGSGKPKEKKKLSLKLSKNKTFKNESGVESVNGKESLEELVIKSIKWSEAIYKQNKKIKRHLNLMTVANYLKLIIILAPIIFAVFYLPSLLKQLMAQYGSLLGGAGFANIGDIFANGSELDIADILSGLSSQ